MCEAEALTRSLLGILVTHVWSWGSNMQSIRNPCHSCSYSHSLLGILVTHVWNWGSNTQSIRNSCYYSCRSLLSIILHYMALYLICPGVSIVIDVKFCTMLFFYLIVNPLYCTLRENTCQSKSGSDPGLSRGGKQPQGTAVPLLDTLFTNENRSKEIGPRDSAHPM